MGIYLLLNVPNSQRPWVQSSHNSLHPKGQGTPTELPFSRGGSTLAA